MSPSLPWTSDPTAVQRGRRWRGLCCLLQPKHLSSAPPGTRPTTFLPSSPRGLTACPDSPTVRLAGALGGFTDENVTEARPKALQAAIFHGPRRTGETLPDNGPRVGVSLAWLDAQVQGGTVPAMGPPKALSRAEGPGSRAIGREPGPARTKPLLHALLTSLK